MAERRQVQVGDVELCVESFGDPEQPTVLLVAGAAGAMEGWDDELCTRLTEGGRHVVRYDHRDTGESTTGAPGGPSYAGWQLGEDCAGLIEALGAGPVHLVGVSMGGGIAQMIALRHPDLVAGLTLVATTAVGGVDADLPGPSPRLQASFENPPADPEWADAESYADWVLEGARTYAGSIPVDERRVRVAAAALHARAHDPAAAANHWLVVAGEGDEDQEPLDVRRIGVPTLVIHGSEDPLFPLPHGRALADAVPGAEWLEVPGMGHEVPPPVTWDDVVPVLLRHTAEPVS